MGLVEVFSLGVHVMGRKTIRSHSGERIFRPKQDFEKGEEVKVISGPFASFNGTIDDIDLAKGRLRLSVQIFGRSTPVEVDFSQVEKVLV